MICCLKSAAAGYENRWVMDNSYIGSYDFTVAHGNYHPDDVEFPQVQKTDTGLQFRAYALSSISVDREKLPSQSSGGTTTVYSIAVGDATNGISDSSALIPKGQATRTQAAMILMQFCALDT